MKKLCSAIAMLVFVSSVSAASAFWTGQQRQVQTVTYQMAWECQYNYNGQLFWRVFKNGCPSNVEVQ